MCPSNCPHLVVEYSHSESLYYTVSDAFGNERLWNSNYSLHVISTPTNSDEAHLSHYEWRQSLCWRFSCMQYLFCISPESKMTAHVEDKRQTSKLILPARAIQSVSSGGPAREQVAKGSAWRNAPPPSKAPFSCRQYSEKSNPHHWGSTLNEIISNWLRSVKHWASTGPSCHHEPCITFLSSDNQLRYAQRSCSGPTEGNISWCKMASHLPPPPHTHTHIRDQYTTRWPSDASLGATLTKNNARTQTCALILFSQNYPGAQRQGWAVTGSLVSNLMTLYQLLHRASLPYIPTPSSEHWNWQTRSCTHTPGNQTGHSPVNRSTDC